MKKLLVTILALIYLGSSTGAMMHLHYCMGKLAETSFSKKSNATCNKCGMKTTQKKKWLLQRRKQVCQKRAGSKSKSHPF